MSRSDPLSLQSKDDKTWINHTGFSTNVVLDLVAFHLCKKVIGSTSLFPPDRINSADIIKASLSVKAQMVIKSNPAFRTLWAEIVKQSSKQETRSIVSHSGLLPIESMLCF